MQHDININFEKDTSIYKFITNDNSISEKERPSYNLQSMAEEISYKIMESALEQLEQVSIISSNKSRESSCDNHSVNNTLIDKIEDRQINHNVQDSCCSTNMNLNSDASNDFEKTDDSNLEGNCSNNLCHFDDYGESELDQKNISSNFPSENTSHVAIKSTIFEDNVYNVNKDSVQDIYLDKEEMKRFDNVNNNKDRKFLCIFSWKHLPKNILDCTCDGHLCIKDFLKFDQINSHIKSKILFLDQSINSILSKFNNVYSGHNFHCFFNSQENRDILFQGLEYIFKNREEFTKCEICTECTTFFKDKELSIRCLTHNFDDSSYYGKIIHKVDQNNFLYFQDRDSIFEPYHISTINDDIFKVTPNDLGSLHIKNELEIQNEDIFSQEGEGLVLPIVNMEDKPSTHTFFQNIESEKNQLFSIYNKSDNLPEIETVDNVSESSSEYLEENEIIINHPNFILNKDIYSRRVNYPKILVVNENNVNKSFPECYFENEISEFPYLNYATVNNETFIENIDSNYSDNFNIELDKFNIDSIFYNPGYCSCIIKEQNPRLKMLARECKCFLNCICETTDILQSIKLQKYDLNSHTSIFNHPGYCSCILAIYDHNIGRKLDKNKCYCHMYCICNNSNILVKLKNAIKEYEKKAISNTLHFHEMVKNDNDTKANPKTIRKLLFQNNYSWKIERILSWDENIPKTYIYHKIGDFKTTHDDVEFDLEQIIFCKHIDNYRNKTILISNNLINNSSELLENPNRISQVFSNLPFKEEMISEFFQGRNIQIKNILVEDWEKSKTDPCLCLFSCLCHLRRSHNNDSCLCQTLCFCQNKEIDLILNRNYVGNYKFNNNLEKVRFLNTLVKNISNKLKYCKCNNKCKCDRFDNKCKCIKECNCIKQDIFENEESNFFEILEKENEKSRAIVKNIDTKVRVFDMIKSYLEKIKSPVRTGKEVLSSNLKSFISTILGPIKILNYLFSAIPVLSLLIMTIGLYFGLEWVLLILIFSILSISLMLIYDKKKSNYKTKIRRILKNSKRKIRMRSFKAWKVRQKFGRSIKSRLRILGCNKRSKYNTFVRKTTTAKLDPYYPILIPLYINDQLVNAEIDSGSGRSIISQSLMEKLHPNFLLDLPELNNNIKLWDVQGNILPILSNKLVPILVPNYGIVRTSLIIINDSLDSFLIGRDFMQKTKMSLVYKDSKTLSVTYNKEQEFLQNRETIKLKPNQVKEIDFELSNKKGGLYKIINSNSKLCSQQDEVVLSKENKVKIKNIYNHDILYKKGTLKFMIAKIESSKESPKDKEEDRDFMNRETKNESDSYNMDESLDAMYQNFMNSPEQKRFLNRLIIEEIKNPTLSSSPNYIKFLKKAVNEEIKDRSNSNMLPKISKLAMSTNEKLSEDEYLKYCSKNNLGINIQDFYKKVSPSVEDIMGKIKCSNDSKVEIAKIIYNNKCDSRHAFDMGATNNNIPPIEVKIKEGCEVPKNTKIYRGSYRNNLNIAAFFQFLTFYGLARPADSNEQFGAPCFIVARAGSEKLPRLCIDLRKNNLVVDNNVQISTMEPFQTLLDLSAEAKYCTSLDLRQAFYSLRVGEKTIKSGMQNVITPGGAYVMLRSLTGLSSTPAALQSIIGQYIHINTNGDLDPIKGLIHFFDDLNIISNKDESLSDHIDKVKEVLDRLAYIGFKINIEKSNFCVDLTKESVKILGYEFSSGSLKVPSSKLDILRKLKIPTSLRELQVYLGSLIYFKNMLSSKIQAYMQILNKNCKAMTDWVLSPKAKEAFEKIQKSLKDDLQKVENIPDPTLQFVLSDGSGDGIGGVLINTDLTPFLPQNEILSKKFKIDNVNETSEIRNIIDNENIKCLAEGYELFQVLFDASKLLNFTFSDDNTFLEFIKTLSIHAVSSIEFSRYLIQTSTSIKETFDVFTKDMFDYDKRDLDDPWVSTLLLRTLSNLMRRKLVFISIYKEKLTSYHFGNQDAETIYILDFQGKYYVLHVLSNIEIFDLSFKKTLKKFDISQYTEKEILDCLFKQLKNNEDFHKHSKIINIYSKSIPENLLGRTSSAHIELLSILSCLEYFEPQFSSRNIYSLCDNVAATKVLNSNSKTNKRNSKLETLSLKISMYFGSRIKFLHVSGMQNFSDMLSRLIGEENLDRAMFPKDLSLKTLQTINIDWDDTDNISIKQVSAISSLKIKANDHFNGSLKTIEYILKSIYSSMDLFNILYSIASGDYITMARSIIGFFVNDFIPKLRSFNKMPSKNNVTIKKIFNHYSILILLKRYLFQIMRKYSVIRIILNVVFSILSFLFFTLDIMRKCVFKVFNVRQNIIDLIENNKGFVFKTINLKNTELKSNFSEPGVIAKNFSDIFSKSLFITLQNQENISTSMDPNRLVHVDNKILLPKRLYILFTLAYHQSLGHPGFKRLYNTLNTYFYIEKKMFLRNIVRTFTESCSICAISKQNHHKNLRGSTFDNKVSHVNELITFDLLELSKFQNKLKKSTPVKAILVICDTYSKYITLYCLYEVNSKTVINCLANYFQIHGNPRMSLADNASVFSSKEVVKFLTGSGVIRLKSAAYSSASRGFIERRIKIVQTMIRIYFAKQESNTLLDFQLAVSCYGFCLNQLPIEDSILTPFNCHFASVKGLGDQVLNSGPYLFQTGYFYDKKSLDQRLSEKHDSLLKYIIDTMEKIKAKRLSKMRKDNLKRIPNKISVGSYVLLKDFSRDKEYYNKQRPIFLTDIFVVNKRNKYNAEICNMYTGQVINKAVHLNDLKLLHHASFSKLKIPDELLNRIQVFTAENIADITYPNILNRVKNRPIRENINLNDNTKNEEDDDWIIHEDFPHDVDDFTQELETIVEE